VLLEAVTETRARAPASAGRAWTLAGVAAALLAAGLAAIGARRSFSLDEAETVLHARRGWSALAPFDADPSGSAYAALLHGWLQLGTSEWLARVPSIAALALATGVVHLLGGRLLGRRAGALAAAALATSAFAVGAGRTADALALGLLAAVLATWLLGVALESEHALAWVAYTLVAAVGVYVHASCALVLPAHAVALAFAPRPSRRAGAVAVAAAGAAAAPAVALVLVRARHLIDPLRQPSLGDVGRSVHDASGRNALLLALAAGGLAALAAGLPAAAEAWVLPLLVTWAAGPLVLLLALSIARPSLDVRYLVVSAPAVSLLAGAGLAALPLREALLAALVATLALAAVRVVQLERSTAEDWRSGVAAAFAVRRPGERVVVAPARALSAFARYAGRDRGSLVARGPAVVVLVRADGAESALELARRAVSAPAYALRDERRLDDRLWLQRWERTGLPARRARA